MPSIPDTFQDLLQTQVAVLATVGSNGRPQQSATWFLAEGGSISFSLSGDRQKTSNLRRDPNCSVFLFDPANLFRYLEIRGTAQLEPDPDYEFASQVGAKYGADLRQYDKPGDARFKVTLVAERVRPVDMSA